jgi:hypothetical protein
VYSRDTLLKAKGDHLDRVHPDEMVLEMVRWGRLVLFIGSQESQNLLKGDWQPRVHSDQAVLVLVGREAGPCERRPTQELHSLKTLK